jgi:hypothetical protein
MSRLKKSRKAKGFIPSEEPSRRELRADPDSYDSRRRKAAENKKKNKSVFEKQREAEKNSNQQTDADKRKTRLQDKIRRLNKEKSEPEK